MLLYHTTNAADAILAEGFRDGEGLYMTDQIHHGVWLTSRPPDSNEGAKGDMVLVVDIPEDVVAPYEWIGDHTSGWAMSPLAYREFLVPADLVNQYGPPQLMEKDNDYPAFPFA